MGEDKPGRHLPFLLTNRLLELAHSKVVKLGGDQWKFFADFWKSTNNNIILSNTATTATTHETETNTSNPTSSSSSSSSTLNGDGNIAAVNNITINPVTNNNNTSSSSSLVVIENKSESVLPQDFAKRILTTELTAYIPDTIITEAKKLLSPRLLQTSRERIHLPDTAKGVKGQPESVSELNGLAIPAMLEVKVSGNCSMYDQLIDVSNDASKNMHPYIRERLKTLRKPNEMTTPAHFLELATIYQAGASISCRGFISKSKQLKSFDWMTNMKAGQCLRVLEDAVCSDCRIIDDLIAEPVMDIDHTNGDELTHSISSNDDSSVSLTPPSNENFIFEEVLEATVTWNSKPAKSLTIMGAVDILTSTTLWEIKCVNRVTDLNFLQLGVYAWLWRRSRELSLGKRRFKLLNVVNGEIWEINSDISILDQMMNLLIQHHFRSQTEITDEQFLAEALAVSGKAPGYAAFNYTLKRKLPNDTAMVNGNTNSNENGTHTPLSEQNYSNVNTPSSQISISQLLATQMSAKLGFQSTYDYHNELRLKQQQESRSNSMHIPNDIATIVEASNNG